MEEATGYKCETCINHSPYVGVYCDDDRALFYESQNLKKRNFSCATCFKNGAYSISFFLTKHASSVVRNDREDLLGRLREYARTVSENKSLVAAIVHYIDGSRKVFVWNHKRQTFDKANGFDSTEECNAICINDVDFSFQINPDEAHRIVSEVEYVLGYDSYVDQGISGYVCNTFLDGGFPEHTPLFEQLLSEYESGMSVETSVAKLIAARGRRYEHYEPRRPPLIYRLENVSDPTAGKVYAWDSLRGVFTEEVQNCTRIKSEVWLNYEQVPFIYLPKRLAFTVAKCESRSEILREWNEDSYGKGFESFIDDELEFFEFFNHDADESASDFGLRNRVVESRMAILGLKERERLSRLHEMAEQADKSGCFLERVFDERKRHLLQLYNINNFCAPMDNVFKPTGICSWVWQNDYWRPRPVSV